ncbi:MAG: TraB/GumN family protein [Desulfobulbaceae bacterium]|uniref:TraB/GumN family protein n=1 Tax=Candidatus Desulfatifera sulfidica TaxID=2841691 RepID=A0A8J6N8B4_9BACT|nr:TraB/GumN family protein [Candidatus Desulfatifera sulfidica]
MNQEQPFPSRDYGPDVHIIQHGEKTILLAGTAHISRESADLVRELIENEHPDLVCIELDSKRYEALSRKKRWQALDLKQIIRNKQLSALLVNLFMSSYQKKLGAQLGVNPGTELLTAGQTAEKLDIPICLCDRDVRITLRRAWKSTSFFKKGTLFATLLSSLFDRTEVSEEKLNELKQKDMLAELVGEMGEVLPDVKKVLIDERDIFMAEQIKKATGKRIVAVVGAGHAAGIQQVFSQDNQHQLAAISQIPPVGIGWKITGWAIPTLIIGSIITIGIKQGATDAASNIAYWTLANGIPTAIGALIALAHPLTILTAFAAAPLTSLTPVIGAGYVAAFIQVMNSPPVVREFETVTEDMGTIKGWWNNKLLKVFLVFILTGLGSTIGTYVGGYEIIKNLIG